ncbi:esterase-like activity of phytase family protein [Flavobacteriaceae bacterium M23B6Z8]
MGVKSFVFSLVLTTLLFSCSSNDDADNSNIEALRFIGEQVIAPSEIEGTAFGGLSSIDYANGKWYAISDDSNTPIRFYTIDLEYDAEVFEEASVEGVTFIKNEDGTQFESGKVDPEALRLDPATGTFIWASEGQINEGISPSIREIDISGTQIRELPLPSLFSAISSSENSGPRQNGTLEGLSLSKDNKGYWVAMELPLKQDGEAPALSDTNAPVRITLLDRFSGKVKKQFVYQLENIVRDSNPPGGFSINGLVEILALNDRSFLVLERSFATGYSDGGNNVKIYKIDASEATDVKDSEQLSQGSYTPVTKTLLFDFESIRSQLTDGIVDNIEGISFGPDLPNGNKSLVVVADNNFNAFGAQLNQFIVFEVIP